MIVEVGCRILDPFLFFGALRFCSACMPVVLILVHITRIFGASNNCKAFLVLKIGDNIDNDYHLVVILTIVLPKSKEGIEIFIRI